MMASPEALLSTIQACASRLPAPSASTSVAALSGMASVLLDVLLPPAEQAHGQHAAAAAAAVAEEAEREAEALCLRLFARRGGTTMQERAVLLHMLRRRMMAAGASGDAAAVWGAVVQREMGAAMARAEEEARRAQAEEAAEEDEEGKEESKQRQQEGEAGAEQMDVLEFLALCLPDMLQQEGPPALADALLAAATGRLRLAMEAPDAEALVPAVAQHMRLFTLALPAAMAGAASASSSASLALRMRQVEDMIRCAVDLDSTLEVSTNLRQMLLSRMLQPFASALRAMDPRQEAAWLQRMCDHLLTTAASDASSSEPRMRQAPVSSAPTDAAFALGFLCLFFDDLHAYNVEVSADALRAMLARGFRAAGDTLAPKRAAHLLERTLGSWSASATDNDEEIAELSRFWQMWLNVFDVMHDAPPGHLLEQTWDPLAQLAAEINNQARHGGQQPAQAQAQPQAQAQTEAQARVPLPSWRPMPCPEDVLILLERGMVHNQATAQKLILNRLLTGKLGLRLELHPPAWIADRLLPLLRSPHMFPRGTGDGEDLPTETIVVNHVTESLATTKKSKKHQKQGSAAKEATATSSYTAPAMAGEHFAPFLVGYAKAVCAASTEDPKAARGEVAHLFARLLQAIQADGYGYLTPAVCLRGMVSAVKALESGTSDEGSDSAMGPSIPVFDVGSGRGGEAAIQAVRRLITKSRVMNKSLRARFAHDLVPLLCRCWPTSAESPVGLLELMNVLDLGMDLEHIFSSHASDLVQLVARMAQTPMLECHVAGWLSVLGGNTAEMGPAGTGAAGSGRAGSPPLSLPTPPAGRRGGGGAAAGGGGGMTSNAGGSDCAINASAGGMIHLQDSCLHIGHCCALCVMAAESAPMSALRQSSLSHLDTLIEPVIVHAFDVMRRAVGSPYVAQDMLLNCMNVVRGFCAPALLCVQSRLALASNAASSLTSQTGRKTGQLHKSATVVASVVSPHLTTMAELAAINLAAMLQGGRLAHDESGQLGATLDLLCSCLALPVLLSTSVVPSAASDPAAIAESAAQTGRPPASAAAAAMRAARARGAGGGGGGSRGRDRARARAERLMGLFQQVASTLSGLLDAAMQALQAASVGPQRGLPSQGSVVALQVCEVISSTYSALMCMFPTADIASQFHLCDTNKWRFVLQRVHAWSLPRWNALREDRGSAATATTSSSNTPPVVWNDHFREHSRVKWTCVTSIVDILMQDIGPDRLDSATATLASLNTSPARSAGGGSGARGGRADAALGDYNVLRGLTASFTEALDVCQHSAVFPILCCLRHVLATHAHHAMAVDRVAEFTADLAGSLDAWWTVAMEAGSGNARNLSALVRVLCQPIFFNTAAFDHLHGDTVEHDAVIKGFVRKVLADAERRPYVLRDLVGCCMAVWMDDTHSCRFYLEELADLLVYREVARTETQVHELDADTLAILRERLVSMGFDTPTTQVYLPRVEDHGDDRGPDDDGADFNDERPIVFPMSFVRTIVRVVVLAFVQKLRDQVLLRRSRHRSVTAAPTTTDAGNTRAGPREDEEDDDLTGRFLASLAFCILDREKSHAGERMTMPNSVSFGRKLRSWQALCILLPVLQKREDVERALDGLWIELQRTCYHEIRFFMEMAGTGLAIVHGRTVLTRVVHELQGRGQSQAHWSNQSVASLFILLGSALHFKGDGGKCAALLAEPAMRREILSGVLPWLSCSQAFVRVIAQVLVRDILEQEFAGSELEDGAAAPGTEAKSENDGDHDVESALGGTTYLQQQYRFLCTNKEVQKAYRKQKRMFKRDPMLYTTVTGLLSIGQSPYAEFVVPHIITLVEESMRELHRENAAAFSAELAQSQREQDEEEGKLRQQHDKSAISSTTSASAMALLAGPAAAARVEEACGTMQRKISPMATLELHVRELAAEQALNASGRPWQDIVVCASLVNKVPNLAGLSRTCEIFAVRKLTIPNKTVLAQDAFTSISVTAERWIDIEEVPEAGVLGFLRRYKARGYSIVALEQTDGSELIMSTQLPRRMVLLLGKEKQGVPADLLNEVDLCVEIPQFGVVRSLNVHVSASLALWEYTRQFGLSASS